MRIQTADQQIAVRNGGGYRAWLSGIIRDRHGYEINWDNIADDAEPLTPHITNGDWVCKCDLLADSSVPCGGSIVCTPADPYFFCDQCCNVSVNHKLRKIDFPQEKDRLIIEELLTLRPHPNLRHYRPQNGETIALLQQENVDKPWAK